MIRTLKERIKKIEPENKDLMQQNEIAYGEVLKAREQQKLARLEAKEVLKVESGVTSNHPQKSDHPEKSEPINKQNQLQLSLVSSEHLLEEELHALGVHGPRMDASRVS